MSWIDDLGRATRANMRDGELRALVARAPSITGLIAAGEALVRERLPYRFEGQGHRILSFALAQRRGFGACGESTAVFAALAALAHVPTVSICYEEAYPFRGYAHVRILVDGYAADAYRDRRIDVPQCSHVIDLAALLGTRWRARADATNAQPRRG